MAIGLAMSGHTVRVLEESSRLAIPFGGIRVPPNVTKILTQWGLEDDLRRKGTIIREGSNLWDCTLFYFYRYLLSSSTLPSPSRPCHVANCPNKMRPVNSSDTLNGQNLSYRRAVLHFT